MFFARHAKSLFLLATVQLNFSSCDFFAVSKVDPRMNHRESSKEFVRQVAEESTFYDANISARSMLHEDSLVERR